MRTAEQINAALDSALEMTFPASDPIAVYVPEQPNSSGKRLEQADWTMHQSVNEIASTGSKVWP